MPDEDTAPRSDDRPAFLVGNDSAESTGLVGTGLLGLIVGASLPLVLPHKSSAVTDLYLAQTAGADPAHAMADNVSLLQTDAVAKQAVSTGHLDMSPSALLSHYSGLPLSDTIMSIKFNGASQSEAVAGARAVAQAFLAVQAKELRLQTDVLVRGLQSEISSPQYRDRQSEYADQLTSPAPHPPPATKRPIRSPIWSISAARTSPRCPSSRRRFSRPA